MSIRSTVGNIQHNVGDIISGAHNTARTQLSNIVGSAQTALTNVWSGGFTGMSDTGIAELKTQLTNYCQEVQDIISGFDQTGDITSALKGEPQDAAYEFIEAIKELLQAYVSTMKQEIDEMDEAYNNFVQSGTSIASDVRSHANDIRTDANSIRLD